MSSRKSANEILFRPIQIGSLSLPNRIVMPPMTRGFSPGGVPGPDVAAYYRRRAEGGAGLIITEGTWIPHPTASNDPGVPSFYGEDALMGWAHVLKEVHDAGGKIVPQLWHIGVAPKSDVAEIYGDRPDERADLIGPSGLASPGVKAGREMSQQHIDDVGEAYVTAAATAYEMGFDGIELHAAHGYLIDQFFWDQTNLRKDRYGGSIANRNRFAVDIVKAIRAKTASDFPIILRFSQWKLQDYEARPWPTPQTLENFLGDFVDAGVDIFDCSQRRFWEPMYDGSGLNLAGWTQKLSGLPAISVGSVTLSGDFMSALAHGARDSSSGLGELIERMERDEFDLIAVGRALIANPDWLEKVRHNRMDHIIPFRREMLSNLD
jgi:2,4-dienoyl-CoA reductase-like NADH-dependent reductase (Old Yellow Enzyme family)